MKSLNSLKREHTRSPVSRQRQHAQQQHSTQASTSIKSVHLRLPHAYFRGARDVCECERTCHEGWQRNAGTEEQCD